MKKYFGDKAFYRHLLVIVVPILIQNAITNFVNLLDNIMVGQVGTNPMSGVSIVNQLIFIFNLCLFGGLAGAGIFTAQFFGKQDVEGIRHTFRFKILIVAVIDLLAIGILFFFGEDLITFYMHQNGEAGDAAQVLYYGKQYLSVMFLEMIPFSLTQAYASTLRECDDTMLPMKAGIVAIVMNLILNYLLIYGKLGLPALGVVGAALATAIARLFEAGIVLIYTHRHSERHAFIRSAYRSMHIPRALALDMMRKGFPLLLNETLWSMGIAALGVNYAVRGLEVIAANNISNTLSNLFNVIFFSMGSATAIILGQELGAGNPEVKTDAGRLAITSVGACVVTGSLMFLCAGFFPEIYNTEPGVRELATGLIRISACFSPLFAYENVAYFTIRSGGKTWITFVFDAGYLWLIPVPFSYLMVHYTAMPILTIYLLVQCLDFIKAGYGLYLVRKGNWIQDLTGSSKTVPEQA
ncbi:MAG: MATE family efflux transporter [Lachnospiraceae bacterium]|nr:MATE family efflux transporter [Lachnospiraceae bacterium]